MRYRSKTDTTIDVVKVPNNEFADHPMAGWEETPDWLQQAFNDRLISPRFGGEDYWYYDVKWMGRTQPAAPDDYIVRDAFGTVSVLTAKEIQRSYNRLPEADSETVPVYLENAWDDTQVGIAAVQEDGSVIITFEEDHIRGFVGSQIRTGLTALKFIAQTPKEKN